MAALDSRTSRTCTAAFGICVLALAPWSGTRADQGGVPFWLSGSYASLAATPADPGVSLSATPYYYSGSANAARAFARGNFIATGLRSDSPLMMLQPGYAFDTRIAGGQAYVGLGFGYGRNITDASLALRHQGSASASDSLWGWTDAAPFASLTWSRGSQNWMTYLTGNVPVGSYDSSRLANLGLGHAAIDGGAGYTYLNLKNGHEFSAVFGVTYNWQNTEVSYRNGIDSHLDWAASQFLSERFHLGVVGYVYQQVSDDQYPTAGAIGALRERLLGGFQSHIAAVGPEAGYLFNVNGHQAYANLRGYWEFWVKDRVEGHAIFLAVNIPF